MLCPSCSQENAEVAKFCSRCGTHLELHCGKCGAVNSAASKFCQQCGARLAPGSPSTSTVTKEPSGTTTKEERRWVTVLFADLSGFTALAGEMDHEDVKSLAHRCAERMSQEVRNFGGTVINVVGDQIVAVFGAPLTHEDDAERAVRAGLAIRDCSLSTDLKQPIEVHVGINTGNVMAGLIGPEEHRDYTVMGDTVNMAARLMSAAPPGSVLVGEESFRATRRVVRYRELPPVIVKGKEQPISVWEALDAASVSKARPLGTAPLVGRDEELAVLSGVWLKVVRESRPHLMSILGEPGIGKSRLVGEFERRNLAESNAVVIHGRCLPYGEAVGYGALAQALKEGANIAADDNSTIARTKLNQWVASAMGSEQEEASEEVARHLALLSGLEVLADRSASAADQRTLHVSVRRFLETLALQKPLCLMFEDIHWADSALLDLIEFVAARAKEVPLLIVTQARPALLEKRPNWGGGVRAFNSLALEALSENAGRDLIMALCRERQLPEEVAEQVGRGAGGNPLFAEELVAMIAERGTGAGIPSAITALISARLDSLPAAQRSTLQFAAVFGKVFWEAGLRALCGNTDVATPLEALEQKDFVRLQARSQLRGNREYIFKHDLIRDVAYETLSRAERRLLHGSIADWIEQVSGEQVEACFDLLAHHALSSGQEERALGYLMQAAERTRRMAAHRQEAALLAQAIQIAERLGKLEIIPELKAKRGKAFANATMWADARGDLEAALQGLPLERMERRAEVLIDLASACFYLMDIQTMRRYATEALPLAEASQRGDLAAATMAWLGTADQSDGDIPSALEHYRRARTRAGGRPVPALCMEPLTLYFVGQIEQAVELGREDLQRLSRLNDTAATMWGYPHLGLALTASGQYAEALQIFEEARRFGREYEVGPFLARCISVSAGLHLEVFDFVGNLARAEEARDLARSHSFLPPVMSSGLDMLLCFARTQEIGQAEKLAPEVEAAVLKAAGWHGWVWKIRFAEAQAEIALARGDWAEAVRGATDAMEQARAKGRVKYESLGLWTRGRAMAASGRKHEAIADLGKAIEISRPIGDPAMFLRAATALLEIEGSDALLTEARTTARKILAQLPDEDMRRRFEAAEPVRVLGSLGR